MKRFLSIISVFLVLVLAAAATASVMTVSAKTTVVSNNVVFVSDSAATDGITGDGSSAEKPLDVYEVPAYKPQNIPGTKENTENIHYLKTALYQAAEKLAETGGTIVICGPVNIGEHESYGSGSSNRDFFFPNSDQPLRITSVYDGVDYAKTKGAYLGIALPAQISMRSPSVFENITIKTTGADRAICANGNSIVMGEGVTCEALSGTSSKYYLSVAGAHRYSNFTGDTDVTVKSGTYNFIGGSNWGLLNPSVYSYVGNAKVSVEGGTVKGGVVGGTVKSALTTNQGDITINIYENVVMNGSIYGSGQAQFAKTGNTVTINLYGGNYTDTAAKVYKYYTASTAASYPIGVNTPADNYVLNISNAAVTASSTGSSKAKVLNSFVESAVSEGFSEIRYPASWATSVSAITYPTATFGFEGEKVSSEGAKISVSYKNAYNTSKTYSKVLEYIPEDTAFSVSVSSDGTASYYYGSKCYGTGSVEVIPSPTVNIKGVQLKTSGDVQGMRYVAEYSYNPPEGMAVKEYGVIEVPANLFEDAEMLDFEHTSGMNVLTPGADDINATINKNVIYSATVNKIPQNRYNTDRIARAYLKLEYNGEIIYKYSDIITRNPYKVALLAAKSDSVETPETRNHLKNSLIAVQENYSIENEYADSKYLREKVVAYMRDQMNLTWTPSESFWIYNNSGSGVSANLYFEAGKTYKGIPYTNDSFSQKESFSDYITNGVLDISKMGGVSACGNTTSDQTTAYNNYKVFPGSDCSTAVVTAWNTVLNSRVQLGLLKQTKYMVPGNGCGVVPVGDYDYDYAKYANNTYNMTGDSVNGQKIYAAYSLLQPGDAIVHYNAENGAGHTRLVVSVNKSAKTVKTIECANWSVPKCTVTSGDGTSKSKVTLYNNNTSWMELEYTFDYLLKDGYVPITIPELVTGNSDSEFTLVTELDLARDLPVGKLNGRIFSNRQIISVDITVSDGNNIQTVSDVVSKSEGVHLSRMELSSLDLSSLKLTSGKKYTFNLSVRVVGLTENAPTVKLIKDYEFTAK